MWWTYAICVGVGGGMVAFSTGKYTSFAFERVKYKTYPNIIPF